MKEIVKIAEYHWLLKSSYSLHYSNQEYRQKWIEAGAQIHQISEGDVELIKKVSAEVYAELAQKSPEAREFVEKYIEVLKATGHGDWAEEIETQLAS